MLWPCALAGRPTASIVFLWGTFFCAPVYAESLAASPRQAEATAPESPKGLGARLAEVDALPVDRITVKYVEGYFVDTGRMLASPLHWDSKDWLTMGLVVGVTSSLFLVDEHAKNFAQSHQSRIASNFATVGNDLGNALYTLPPVAAFYLYGYLADDGKARRASLLAVESFAISGAMTSALKVIADRHRPNSGDSPTTWDGPRLSLKNLSFSSEHTASAFSIATVFAEEYRDNAYVAPIAYSLATLTGLSRVYSNEHWLSDAVFGAAIGYFVSKAVLRYHKEDTNHLGGSLTILPEVSKEMTGLTVRYDF
jgi:membrane-associated phospholipid phosphatase